MEKITDREKKILTFFNKYCNLEENKKFTTAIKIDRPDLNNSHLSHPYSWNVVALELFAGTTLGFELLNEMKFDGKN